jgi:hypothetical protein
VKSRATFAAAAMAGAYPALIALIGLGIGAFIRHTAGAICVLVGVLFVAPLLFAPLSPSVQDTAQNFLPHPMANSLTAVKPAVTPEAPRPAGAVAAALGTRGGGHGGGFTTPAATGLPSGSRRAGIRSVVMRCQPPSRS